MGLTLVAEQAGHRCRNAQPHAERTLIFGQAKRLFEQRLGTGDVSAAAREIGAEPEQLSLETNLARFVDQHFDFVNKLQGEI